MKGEFTTTLLDTDGSTSLQVVTNQSEEFEFVTRLSKPSEFQLKLTDDKRSTSDLNADGSVDRYVKFTSKDCNASQITRFYGIIREQKIITHGVLPIGWRGMLR